jgi:hypothetical protein
MGPDAEQRILISVFKFDEEGGTSLDAEEPIRG